MEEGNHNRNENLAKFIEITQIPQKIAKEIMENTNWDLDVAVAQYYSGSQTKKNKDQALAAANAADNAAAGTLGSSTSGGATSAGSFSSRTPKEPVKTNKTSRIATINHREIDSDEEQGEAYYQGGSERSGQQILGPPGRKKDNQDLVGRMFKSAKEHGAIEADSHSCDSGVPKLKSFSGTGYRLSDTATPSGESSVPSTSGIMANKPGKISVVLKFWKKSFSLDDGPERLFSDRSNREFLADIEGGMVPRELLQSSQGREVDLSMEDHRNVDYVQPKRKISSFSGTGNVLSSTSTQAPVAAAAPSEDHMTEARQQFPVDDSQPITNIVIRLAGGEQIRERFNESRTIADVIRFITIARPEYAGVNFVLMSSYPKRELSNKDATLKDADILNSVILQRIL